MPNTLDRMFYLNAVYRILATLDHEPRFNFNRFPGVDHLTGEVLEARVALEACRAS